MIGFKVVGKAFCVVEELRQFADQHKGQTVAEWLSKRKIAKIEEAEARQFGLSVEEYRKLIHNKREG